MEETENFKFVEISFSVNDKQSDFFSNKIDKFKGDKFNKNVCLKQVIEQIPKIQNVSSEYLQKVMESNDKLGATLNKVPDIEEE